MRKSFDVVIAGAGIAGLLLASELSLTKKVIVIDRQDGLNVGKFWVTTKECELRNAHLSRSVDSHIHSMGFVDAYRNSYSHSGEFVLWDTIRLMKQLLKQIVDNGGQVQFSQQFYSYRYKNDSILISVNGHEYSCKLFVDAMGSQSPLVLAKNIVQIDGYYLLYGAKLKLKKALKPLALCNVSIQAHPTYLEAFPTADGHAHTVLIYPSRIVRSANSISQDFNFLVESSHYAQYFDITRPVRRLQGIVPVGRLKQRGLDRIFFFGESAQSNPASTGTCLSRLLLGYKNVAGFLDECIEQNTLRKEELISAPVLLPQFSRKLQLNIFNEVLTCNSDKFSAFIRTLDSLSPAMIDKFIFGSLTKTDVLAAHELTSFLHKSNRILVKPILKSFL